MGAGGVAASRAAARRARLTYTDENTTSSFNPEATLERRNQLELSREREKQNAFLKALRLGKFGQRSLLSGSFAGITDRVAPGGLGGGSPGLSVGAAPGAASGTQSGAASFGPRRRPIKFQGMMDDY